MEQNEALLAELAWGLIANAYGGDWGLAPTVWREAAERWLAGAIGKARRALLDALDEPDGLLALKVLERVVPELAPASQRMEVRGLLAKIDLNTMSNEVIDRIANGENPVVVIASAAERSVLLLKQETKVLKAEIIDEGADLNDLDL